MRRLSPKLSDSSAQPSHHRKHRGREPPSTSTTREEELRLSGDPEGEYSPPDDLEQSEDPTSNEDGHDEPANADDEAELASYSDSYPSNSSHASAGFSSPAPSTYINVAPLPTFRGAPGECPVAHLVRFERVCRANNAAALDMVVRIFPVTLDGQAALWYELAIEPETDISWEEIKSAFLEAYRPPDFADRARSELMSIRQRKDESVNAYHLRLQWILKLWPEHGIPDSLLKGVFVDGLREKYQDWIVPQRPESLTEAVRMAMDWERAESAREARRKNEEAAAGVGGGDGGREVVKCGFCDGLHEESGCDVRRRMRELWLRSREGAEAASGRRLLSSEMSLVRRVGGGDRGEEEGEVVGRAVSLRRSQCQCWKHQCWARLDRGNSVAGPNVNQPSESTMSVQEEQNCPPCTEI